MAKFEMEKEKATPAHRALIDTNMSKDEWIKICSETEPRILTGLYEILMESLFLGLSGVFHWPDRFGVVTRRACQKAWDEHEEIVVGSGMINLPTIEVGPNPPPESVSGTNDSSASTSE